MVKPEKSGNFGFRRSKEFPGKEELRHFMIFIYSISDKSQKEKVKILRDLFGYKEVKAKKEYLHEGMLQKNYSKKLGSNVILVPAGFALYFNNYFLQNKIKFEIIDVWMR